MELGLYAQAIGEALTEYINGGQTRESRSYVSVTKIVKQQRGCALSLSPFLSPVVSPAVSTLLIRSLKPDI